MKNNQIEDKVQKFPHVKNHHTVEIAKKTNCHHTYVWMVINGTRSADSTKAKAILRYAQLINEAVSNANARIQFELETQKDSN